MKKLFLLLMIALLLVSPVLSYDLLLSENFTGADGSIPSGWFCNSQSGTWATVCGINNNHLNITERGGLCTNLLDFTKYSYLIISWTDRDPNDAKNRGMRIGMQNNTEQTGNDYFAFRDNSAGNRWVGGASGVTGGSDAASNTAWTDVNVTLNLTSGNITMLIPEVLSKVAPHDVTSNNTFCLQTMDAPAYPQFDNLTIWGQLGILSSILSSTLSTPTNNSVALVNENITFVSNLTDTTNLKNASLYIDYVLNQTKDYSGTSNQTNFSGIVFGATGNHSWFVRACNDAHSCVNSSIFNLTIDNLRINSITYNNQTTSGSLESFVLNISGISFSSVIFVYNNTNYSAGSIVNLGNNNYLITSQITVPFVTASTNKTFYWIVTANGVSYNSSMNNQTIVPINMDDCSAYSQKLLNYTIYDELTRSIISDSNNLSTQVTINLYASDYSTLVKTFSLNSTKNNTLICFQNLSNSYYMDVITQYNGGLNYSTKFNNIQKYFINSSTIPIVVPLYDLPLVLTQEFIITFKNSNFQNAPNVLVDVSRKYISEGIFRSVEVAKTDSSGQTVLHLQLNDVIYTITFIQNGEVLAVLDSMLAKCQNPTLYTCVINANQFNSNIDIGNFSYVNGVAVSQSFDLATKTITANFVVQSGTANILMNVTKFDNLGNTSVCSTSILSSSGSLTCIIPNSFGNITIVSSIYSNGLLVNSQIFSMNQPITDSSYSTVILSLMLIITLSLLFVTDIRGILLGLTVGLVLAGLLMFISNGSLFSIGTSLGFFLILIGLFIYKLNKKEEG